MQTSIKIQYKLNSAGTGTWELRSMNIMPVYLT